MKHDPPPQAAEMDDTVTDAGLRASGLQIAGGPADESSPSESRYRALARATSDIVWVAGPDGLQQGEVAEWQGFTGRSAHGWAWLEAVHPDDREETASKWKEAVGSGALFQVEQRLLRHDGVYRDMLVRAVPVRGASGEIVEWVGTHSDITDRKQSEAKIAISEARYRSLVRATTDIISTGRVDGTELGEIDEWRAFTGLTAEEAANLGWAVAIHPDDRDATVQQWIEAMATGQSFQTMHRLRRHDGVYRTMLCRAVPVRDGSGNILEWISAHNDLTEQRSAEEALREQAELLDLAHDTILACDMDGNIRFWSRGAERVYGFSKAEALGQPSTELLKTEASEPIPEILKILQRDGSWEGELTHTSASGERLTVASRWVVQRDSAGRPVGILKTNNNITERKRTEEALRATEFRFRKLFDSDLMGIAIPDRFGGFLDANDEFLRIVGYTREELAAGKVRWDLMTPPEYQPLDAAHIAEAAQRGSCTPYEKEYIRKDGARVPILCGFALLEGSQDHYIGFLQDLSTQKRVEADLREREQRFGLLAESLPQLIWVTNAAGENVYCNRRFWEYTGIPTDKLMGWDWGAIVHADDLNPTIAKWNRAVESGEPFEHEYQLRRQDGAYRRFLARAVPVRNGAGHIERWLGSSTDTHDQKLAEEALRRSEKLTTAGRLAASMAHEINNPLMSVINSVYLALQDPSLSAETRLRLQDADQELLRVSQFTTQTLRFHRQSVAPGPADLAEIMDSVLAMYAPRVRSLSARIDIDYRTREPLHCFRGEIRQVFANLIGNSLDAIGQGGRLRVRLGNGRSWDAAGSRGIRVTVADSGSGIPVELRSRLFEPFVSTKEITGVGLGLWVTQAIVHKHNGRIAFHSCTEPSRRGTVFSVFLPFGQTAP